MKPRLKFLLLVAFLVGAVSVIRFTPVGGWINPDRLRAEIESSNPLVTRGLYVLVYIVGTILLVPGLLLSFLGALLFPLWEATFYTWLGATIGATLCFGLARLLGREFVDQLLSGRLHALDQRLRSNGFVGLLVIRLVPLFPFNGVNFGCGLTSLHLRDYFLATALGIIPGTLVYQYLFAKLGRRVLSEGFSWHDLADVEVLAPLGVFVVFLAASAWLARRLQRKSDA